MKTIKKRDTIDADLFQYQRVHDNVAEKKVNSEGWEYCPKSEWKLNVRDLNKKSKEEKNEDL